MVRSPSVDKNGLRRGAWSKEEDNKLRAYVLRYGHWNWRQLPKFAGLARCGKSCRLRWLNYLRPGLKRGEYSIEEEEMIVRLREELGNKWSAIAEKLPGRTDNEIKNYWHTHLKKRKKQDPQSTERSNGRSHTMNAMDQKEQDSSISLLECPDEKNESDSNIAAADASTEKCFSSEESFPEFFESFWTEPFFPSTSDSQISSSTSCSFTVLSLEDWGIESCFSLEESFIKSFEKFSTEPGFSTASNGQSSPSTSCNSTASTSKESSADAISSFWTDEPIFSNASNCLISPSTSCNSAGTNSEESSADAFSSFWTGPNFSDESNGLISPSTTCESTVTCWEEASAEDFRGFWTEPIFSNASNCVISSCTSCNSADTNSAESSANVFFRFRTGPIFSDASNGRISPSTSCESTVTS